MEKQQIIGINVAWSLLQAVSPSMSFCAVVLEGRSSDGTAAISPSTRDLAIPAVSCIQDRVIPAMSHRSLPPRSTFSRAASLHITVVVEASSSLVVQQMVILPSTPRVNHPVYNGAPPSTAGNAAAQLDSHSLHNKVSYRARRVLYVRKQAEGRDRAPGGR